MLKKSPPAILTGKQHIAGLGGSYKSSKTDSTDLSSQEEGPNYDQIQPKPLSGLSRLAPKGNLIQRKEFMAMIQAKTENNPKKGLSIKIERSRGMTDDFKISPAQQLSDGQYDLPLRDNLFGASHSIEQRVYGYLDSVGIHPIDISEFLRDSRCYHVK